MEKKKFQELTKNLMEKGYEVIKSIGKGAFGQVLLARKKFIQQLYAVKVISKAQIKKKPFLQKYIEQEIQIMKKLEHKNIVKQQCSFQTTDFILIVLQYCDQGNLLTYQAHLPGKTFTLENAIKILVQVLKGLKCIHEKNFIHRDIKSQNILLKKLENGEIVYKIADFGFARSIGGVGAKTHCGTQKYMAPQIISNSYYGVSVDVWALGVLFYFMIFAEYPFKGHDMKAQINRRCMPLFSLQTALSKKQKMKDLPSQVEDFFQKIFIVDSKKRLTFSNIQKHPLLKDYEHLFIDNAQIYNKIQKNENQKDYVDLDDEFAAFGQPEEDSRFHALAKKTVSNGSKHLQRELQEINFEIQKIMYLRQSANQLFENYSSYLSYSQRIAAKYYLLKVQIFYSDPLLRDLHYNRLPQCLREAQLSKNWDQVIKTSQFKNMVMILQQQNLKAHLIFQDVYDQIQTIISDIKIKNFEKGFTKLVTQKSFDDIKFSYRSTISHIFKAIHDNKKMNVQRLKIKLRLFCCHMINRIFNRKQIKDNFQFYIKWLNQKKIKYVNTFDFHYFKHWIHEENQQNLQKNIMHLHKTFF